MTCSVLKSTFRWSAWPATHWITWLNILRSFPLCCEITLKQWTWNATSGGRRKLFLRNEHFSICMLPTPTTGAQSEVSLHWNKSASSEVSLHWAKSASSESALHLFGWVLFVAVEDRWLIDGIAAREARNAEKRLATHLASKWNREYSQMVYGASLTLPAQLAAGEELPVDDILRDLAAAAPIPTRHGQREAPTEPPAALAAAKLV